VVAQMQCLLRPCTRHTSSEQRSVYNQHNDRYAAGHIESVVEISASILAAQCFGLSRVGRCAHAPMCDLQWSSPELATTSFCANRSARRPPCCLLTFCARVRLGRTRRHCRLPYRIHQERLHSLFGTHSTPYHHGCHSANHTLDLESLRVVASPAALQLPPSPSPFLVSRAFATNLTSNSASYFLVSNTCDSNGAVSKSVACYMQPPF
jgi:hypothetical protein